MSNSIAYVSLDPGLHHFGVALWSFSGELVKAYLAKSCYEITAEPKWLYLGDEIAQQILMECSNIRHSVCEIPQVYSRSKSKGDPNTLVELACAGATALTALGGMPHVVKPAEWKGQLPKVVVEERCKIHLSKDEQKNIVLPIKSLRHNVWDAIGIGLFFLEKRVKIRKPPEKK